MARGSLTLLTSVHGTLSLRLVCHVFASLCVGSLLGLKGNLIFVHFFLLLLWLFERLRLAAFAIRHVSGVFGGGAGTVYRGFWIERSLPSRP